jgi:hypothetical protein
VSLSGSKRPEIINQGKAAVQISSLKGGIVPEAEVNHRSYERLYMDSSSLYRHRCAKLRLTFQLTRKRSPQLRLNEFVLIWLRMFSNYTVLTSKAERSRRANYPELNG